MSNFWGTLLMICSIPAGHIRAEGKIKNVNTAEAFKSMDKAVMLQTAAKQVRIGLENLTIKF